jgi:hypothetical protein
MADAHQDVALRFLRRAETLLAIHCHFAFEQTRNASPALSLATAERDADVIPLRNLQQALFRRIGTSFGGADELDCGSTRARKVRNCSRRLLYDEAFAMNPSRIDT